MPEELKAGRYRIEQEIGRGGMGQVYRAHDTRLGRTVALKMVPAELTHDAELRRRLAQEARAASALNHPGIATVYDFEEHPGEDFIVFEYVEGSTLRERMQQHRCATEEILDAGIQLAEALAAAHARGVVHRDLKPENIMFVAGSGRLPRVKILDFGLAKQRRPLATTAGESAAETATVATARGLVVGTVNYMSPEQVEGEPADARSDLYTLGLVLYEMVTGANPFVGKTPTSTIANILRREAPSVSERNPVAPAELDRILRKCLRKLPEERYQSARELAVDLANLRNDSARPVSAGAAPAKPLKEMERPLEMPRGVARRLVGAIQVGYLAMYVAALIKLEAFDRLTDILGFSAFLSFGSRRFSIPLALVIMLCGACVRLYLLTGISLDYAELGQKYRRLFPVALILDLGWSVSPLLLAEKVGIGLALFFMAALAYLSFAQRPLVFTAYSPHGGRTSGIHAHGTSGSATQ